MILGYDLSNYSGAPSVATLKALRNKYDLRRAILACQFADVYAAQASACITAGVPFEAYLYLYNSSNYVAQLRAALPQLRDYPPERFWLDLEDETGIRPNEAQIREVLAEAQTVLPTGIYTSEGYWRNLGNFNLAAEAPLWLARWTTTPPVEPSGFDAGFGGWVRAPVVQYAGGVVLLDVSLDLDAWSA